MIIGYLREKKEVFRIFRGPTIKPAKNVPRKTAELSKERWLADGQRIIVPSIKELFNLRSLNLNKLLLASGVVAFIFVLSFFIWWQGEVGIEVTNNGEAKALKIDPEPEEKLSPISGIPCENIDKRPIAVMLASDPITRPLSGLARADMVFELPVTGSGVTRMMAVYQCEQPEEIGSIRSAREDFIPLAAGLGAVYAHWGGEREALAKLNGGIIDNVDAMVYENKYFFRRGKLRPPHNGFSSFEKLWQAVGDLKYAQDSTLAPYPHYKISDKTKNLSNLAAQISIDYPHPFKVVWTYDQDKNLYKRQRGSSAEMDKNGGQSSASVVIVMKTDSKIVSKDYMNVRVIGEGEAEIYQDGVKISGKWSKDPSRLDSKLFFYDNEGKEIEFAPGKIWVEVVVSP